MPASIIIPRRIGGPRPFNSRPRSPRPHMCLHFMTNPLLARPQRTPIPPLPRHPTHHPLPLSTPNHPIQRLLHTPPIRAPQLLQHLGIINPKPDTHRPITSPLKFKLINNILIICSLPTRLLESLTECIRRHRWRRHRGRGVVYILAPRVEVIWS